MLPALRRNMMEQNRRLAVLSEVYMRPVWRQTARTSDIRAILRGFILALSAIRLIPHIILMMSSSNRKMVLADLDQWALNCRIERPKNSFQYALLFAQLMTFIPEYRTVFYFRTGLPGKLLTIFCRRIPTLFIDAKRIGPGLFIQHGYGTSVTAEEIGDNCWINQNVTIGFTNDVHCPTIGNNVKINVGATIIGKVHVGDNAKVGANTLVLHDVPANATVIGVPAKVVWVAK